MVPGRSGTGRGERDHRKGDARESRGNGDSGCLSPCLLQGPGPQERRSPGGLGKLCQRLGLPGLEVPAGDRKRSGGPVEPLHIHPDPERRSAGGGDHQTSGVGDADREQARDPAGSSADGPRHQRSAMGTGPGHHQLRRQPELTAGDDSQEGAADSGPSPRLAGAPPVGPGAVRGSQQGLGPHLVRRPVRRDEEMDDAGKTPWCPQPRVGRDQRERRRKSRNSLSLPMTRVTSSPRAVRYVSRDFMNR